MPTDPVEPAYREMLKRTSMTTPICDRRGANVYEVTEEGSVNGVNPDCQDESNASEEDADE